MRIHKKEIAIRQLNAAVDIFIAKGDLLAVLTLAGAAEEILGKLALRQGKSTAMDFIKKVYKKFNNGKLSDDFNLRVNGKKNALKHADFVKDDEVDIDEREQAVAMLSRAIANYSRLDLIGSLPLMEKFSPYICEE